MNSRFVPITLVVWALFPWSTCAQRLITKITTPEENPKIRVGTNETLVIHNHSPGFDQRLVVEGKTNAFTLGGLNTSFPLFLAGPCELTLTGRQIITYRILKDTGIKTLFLRNGQTNELVVPENKTVYFPESVDYVTQNIQINGQSWANLGLVQKNILAGPLKITFSFSQLDKEDRVASRSYIFVEDFSPAIANIAGVPPGEHFFSVERSSDLKTWTPILLQTEQSASPTFYRFKID